LIANDEDGSLASCTSGICSSMAAANIKTGYYRNIGVAATTDAVYIKCVDDATTTKKCTAITVTTTTAANGDIIADSATPTKFMICLDSSITIDLLADGTKDGQYFVEVKTNTNNIFGNITADTYYVLVDIDHGSVTLHPKETGINRYRYADKTTNKLLTDYTSVCSGTTFTGSSTTAEFSLKSEVEAAGTEDPINYYQKVSST